MEKKKAQTQSENTLYLVGPCLIYSAGESTGPVTEDQTSSLTLV